MWAVEQQAESGLVGLFWAVVSRHDTEMEARRAMAARQRATGTHPDKLRVGKRW